MTIPTGTVSPAFPGVTTGTNTDFVCMASGNVLTLQTTACTISSKRFKNQLGHVSDEQALAEITALPGAEVFSLRNQQHNHDPNAPRTQVGLYAEDVAKVDPRAAIYENDLETPKSYRQEAIIALLVGSVRELQQEIRQLKSAPMQNRHTRKR
jgi:hypothetical protein